MLLVLNLFKYDINEYTIQKKKHTKRGRFSKFILILIAQNVPNINNNNSLKDRTSCC